MAIVIRHCKRLVDLCLKRNHRFYLAKISHGSVDHEPVKISIYVIDVFYKGLRWRARRHAPSMTTKTVDHLNDIEASYEGQPGPLPPVDVSTNLTDCVWNYG